MSEAALIQRAEDACRPCGPCDSGLPMGCDCDPEPRAVIAGLLDALASRDARQVAVEALADDFAASKERAARWAAGTHTAFSEAMSRKVAWEEAERSLRAALRSDPGEATT